jgi:hypothetical protein
MEKVIHQIWVGPFEMPNREKRFVQKTKEMNPSWTHILWTNDNLPELPEKLKQMYDFFGQQKDYAHQADVLRIYLVKLFGGVYLDVDFDCINGFENTNLHEYNGVYYNHGGNDYTIPNGVFGSAKDHPLINYIFEQIDSSKWGWYGPSWLGNMVREYYQLPHECAHELLIPKLQEDNIRYDFFYELERDNFKHHALYSWSPENRRNFESGNINYLE